MKLGRGRIGACVVMVSLFAAIIGGWALSTDVTDQTITTYESVADITGYFESSNLPTSIAYNPGENYTGYYTADSNPYFGGVDFTEFKRANNYPIKQPSTQIDSGTNWAITSSDSYIPGEASYFANNRTNYIGAKWAYDLGGVIAALNLSSTADTLKLTSTENYTDLVESSYITFNGALFISKSWASWSSSSDGSRGFHMYFCSYEDKISDPTSLLYRMCLSASVDLKSSVVNLYYDNRCTELCGIYSLSDVVILKNPDTVTTPGAFNTSATVNYTSYGDPSPKYMEISRGVYWS